ncbi:MAG: phosphodiester glycosidase family protein [Bacteroidales bacterium]|nr:phosphodiester glycosidase family protein [Bacteroidales bacterium]
MITHKILAAIVSLCAMVSCQKPDSRQPVKVPGGPVTVEPDRPAKASAVIAGVKSTPVSVAVDYSVLYNEKDYDSFPKPECGVCWNTEGSPTIEDSHQAGPRLSYRSREEMQVISNAVLDYGKTYWFRAYISTGEEIYYSDAVKCSLGKEPEPVALSWTRLSYDGLPESVQVYSTATPLNGRPLNAWYAVADMSKGDVELRVLLPDGLKTIDRQAEEAGDCHVLTNGAYFLAGGNLGFLALKGVQSGYVSDYRGSLRAGHPEYDNYYHATRGCFGVDRNGKPAVYWVGGSRNWFFDRPLPSVIGEEMYGNVSADYPSESISWTPEYALSAGPVLLYDGKCPLDFTLSEKNVQFAGYDEYYLHNYEMIPYDIFNAGLSPDRTAVGYTADGKIILFVCDGRYDRSQGATLTELAMIMKGLGCKAAVNLDGGGSTGMMVGSTHVNDITTGGNRPVWSTIGFFAKK